MKAVQAVAAIEAFKGVVVLVASSTLVTLLPHDLHALALELLQHMHLNPAAAYPRIFVRAMDDLQNTRLLTLALGAGAYVVLRFVEAYGLFMQRSWAEWLSALSGGVYVPFEVAACVRAPTALHFGLLAANVAVVAVVVQALRKRRRATAGP